MLSEERDLVPKIPDVKTLKEYVQPIYIINDYQTTYDIYEKFLRSIRNITCACFVRKKCREYPIKYKFYRDEKETHTMQLRHFLYHCYLWYPFCELSDIKVLDLSFVLEAKDTMNLDDYINEKIIRCLRSYNVKQRIINKNISMVNKLIRSISLDFSDLMNLTFSDVTFFEMWDNPEYRELMQYTSPEGAQPIEIERKLGEYEDRLISLLRADKNNPIGEIIRAGTGLKHKQLVEMLIALAMKPTLDGEVMAYSIDNSSVIGGLDRASYMYIDATAARIPLIMNATKMGDAGYFGINLNKLIMTLQLSKKKTFCNTKHLVPYIIRTKKHLKVLVGKYYKMDPDDYDYQVLTKHDDHMIGKTIYVRSAATCNCGENHICASCIGVNASLLFDIAHGIGAFFTEEVTKRFEQNILSSKHILTTDSEKIEFTKEFYQHFKLIANEISMVIEDGEDISHLAIHVDLADVAKVEEYDDDSTYNTYIKSGTFQIVNLETGEAVDIGIKNGKEIFIVGDIAPILRANNGYLNLKEIGEESPIFAVRISNNELTKPLYELKALLNREEKDFDVTIESISQKLLDNFVQADFGVPIIAAELILNRLIRKENDVMRRPNFAKPKMPKYKVYTLSKCLEHNASPLLGLVYENLKRQVMNDDLERRTSTSYIDVIFKEQIDMKPLKKYKDLNIEGF